MTDELNGSEIAIVGMACRFPGAPDLDSFWRNLRDGVESITFLEEDEIEASALDAAGPRSPDYVPAAALLEDVELFDADFFGITPKEAEVMDPQQRIFLECAWEALEHAGHDCYGSAERVALYAGARTNTYLFNIFANRELLGSLDAFQVGLGNDLAFLSTRVSHKLDLRGPSCSVHTACSTSLVAVHLACQSLLLGEAEMALAGGVAVNVPQRVGYVFQPNGIASPDGHCRTFDARAEGTIFGSGVGIVVLKRLDDALADGDRVHAVVKGSATNNDGAVKASFTAPSVVGQAEVVADAIANAEVEPASISYIEAHGTATALGDAIEIRALNRVFGSNGHQGCAIGSVKTNFGHLDAAAGIAGLIKTVLALENRQLPPSLHFEESNPKIDFASGPFRVNSELREWPRGRTPRRAGVSSFGVGGSNAHVVLEEAPPPEPSDESRPWQPLLLSARSEAVLDAATGRLIEYLEGAGRDESLADVAFTLAVGRRHFGHRRLLVAADRDDALAPLGERDPRRLLDGVSAEGDPGVVFVFPGQGAQHPRMGADLYRQEPDFRRRVDRCCELLEPRLELDLRSLLYPADGAGEEAAERLRQTAIAQPALFVVEYALARLLQGWGVEPRAMIGHSIGELVAACLAGVFSLEDALTLVAERGRMMNRLPAGAMLAVRQPAAEVEALIEPPLSLAASNAPALSVVSGPPEAVEELERSLAAAGTACRRLQTSHAFHSAMMESILEPFAELVRGLPRGKPAIPYVSNVTGGWITDEEAGDPDYWKRHLRRTVRFTEGLGELLGDPATVVLEVGPGEGLTRIARGHPALAEGQRALATMKPPGDSRDGNQLLLTTLGQLWLEAVPVSWRAFYAGERRRRVPLPSYPFERQRYWVEARPPAAGERPKTAGRSAGKPAGKSADVSEWFYLPSWRRALPKGGAVEDAAPRSWCIFEDELGVGAALAAALRDAGDEVISVRPGSEPGRLDDGAYAIEPEDGEGLGRLLEELAESGAAATDLVHLWSLTAEAAGFDQNAESGFDPEAGFGACQERGYYSLLALARAVARQPQGAALRLSVVANGLQEVESADRRVPEKATLLGAATVIPQESPRLTCRTIDVVAPASEAERERLVGQLRAELTGGATEVEVAFRGARRWVRSYEPARLGADGEPPRPLRQEGVYLITGGLGGVGLLLADYLARELRARLVLSGRSSLPERAEWDAWLDDHDDDDGVSRKILAVRELEAAGAEVLVAAADVSDEDQMRALVEAAEERFGALHGVLHAAGITSGTSVYVPVTGIGREESAQQFAPKVRGPYVLERVLEGRELDFCLLFSSTAAVLGGMGYAAYSAANHFMDAFAASREASGRGRWISANWDPWPETTKKYSDVSTSVDRYAMTPQEGAEAFRRLVTRGPAGQVVVATGDLEARYEQWRQGGGRPGAGEPAAQAADRSRSSAAHVAPRNELEARIAAIWQEVLGIPEVGVDDNFFDLGGHSLLMITIQGKLREELGTEVSMVDLFKLPTIGSLAQSLSREEAEEPLFDQADARASRQAAAINRQRMRRRAQSAAAAPPAPEEPAGERKQAILGALASISGADGTHEQAPRQPAAGGPIADEDLQTFADRLVSSLADTAESILYYPHPFSRGGFVVVIPDEGVDVLDCMAEAYAGAPPDVIIYCVRRGEIAELSYPGLFVPADVNGKPHLPQWLRQRGVLLHGTDLRGRIEPTPVEPEVLLEGHLAGCALSLRPVILTKLQEHKYVALVKELDRQSRYLMGTALLTREEWEVDMETLPDRFKTLFPDPALGGAFDQLQRVRRRMESSENGRRREQACEAVWLFESFARQLRTYA